MVALLMVAIYEGWRADEEIVGGSSKCVPKVNFTNIINMAITHTQRELSHFRTLAAESLWAGG